MDNDNNQKKNSVAEDLVGVVHFTWRQIRKVVILIVGSAVILVGVILLITPGPAFVVIPAGIAILSVEFPWAKRVIKLIQIYFYLTKKKILYYWKRYKASKSK